MFEALFQSFDDRNERAASMSRVAALRAELARRGLAGFIVPRADRHQNEFVPPCEERLAWLTGFTGSAGCAVVLTDRAAIFVDGRYQLQVRDQVDTTLFSVCHLVEEPPEKWIQTFLSPGATLGYDAWLHTLDGVEKLEKACAEVGATLAAVDGNPLDAVWTDRPAPPAGPVVAHPFRFAGEETASKLARIRGKIIDLRADALVISDPQSVAWTFNIRGSDIRHVPVALAFAIVPKADRAKLYLDWTKLDDDMRDYIKTHADLRWPDELIPDLAGLGREKRTVRIDQSTAAAAIAHLVTSRGGRLSRGPDPVAMMKAVKNSAEIDGARAAHRRDGAAVVCFLAWFDREVASRPVTEIDAVSAIESFRRQTNELKDVSFPTIAGAGPNGAVVHYRVTRNSNRPVVPNDLFLIDSGAQYLDGTTDITRTIAVGTPSTEMRDRFTRVLKGHIAIARAVFPDGTTGAQLDPLARQALWAAGLDFDHGTGHGVGSYLSVHEGPARISKLGTVALRRGMILSNEPGYYKEGRYGIRIENLVLVIEAPRVSGGEKALNAFETLTLAPIDRRLIDLRMLDADEIAWLDAYHDRVAQSLIYMLDTETRAWLEAATRPLRDR